MVKTSASSSSKTTMSMGPMGGGGNEHTDKRDPQEETEDSSGLGIDYVSLHEQGFILLFKSFWSLFAFGITFF